jgi:maltose alpha-D-glucosyltransferase / alpha-amylase
MLKFSKFSMMTKKSPFCTNEAPRKKIFSEPQEKLKEIFQKIYPKHNSQKEFQQFCQQLKDSKFRIENNPKLIKNEKGWYKKSVVYCLYVDLFAECFTGLTEKLDYLYDLGVTLIWMLPIIYSPLKDSGFDVRNYNKIRNDLLCDDSKMWKIFQDFISASHEKGIKILADMPFNHTSNEHEWFLESKKSKDNPFRDYYLWSPSIEKFKECPIIFEGICESNWEKEGDEFYFHRFFKEQPDLNYSNPSVLLEIGKIISDWCERGIDGFRLDAIPFLWKEDGTDCSGHEKTHQIIKFFRSIVDFVRPGTMLLAESCQEPNKLIKYFGENDQVHAAYHFPLMPQIYLALKRESMKPIEQILNENVTPILPEEAQWFVFLRCHDEFTFELSSKHEKEEIFDHYCQQENWNFRNKNGVSARLSDLLNHNVELISMANSILMSMTGTPIIYYGDEFMKKNDETFFKEMFNISGIKDSRYLCRGRINWKEVNEQLSNDQSNEFKVFKDLKKKIFIRSKISCLHQGKLEIVSFKKWDESIEDRVLGYRRFDDETEILCIHNLSNEKVEIQIPQKYKTWNCLLEKEFVHHEGMLTISPRNHHWLCN